MKRFLILPIFFILFLTAFTANQKVYDNATLLTDEQIQTLQQKCIDVANQNEIDTIILTVNSTGDKTAQQYADDFYDENAFGYEYEHGTGIILLIDMGERNIWISTSGNAIDYFTDEIINNIVNDIAVYLKSEEYYTAFISFLDSVSEYSNHSNLKSEPDTLMDNADNIYEPNQKYSQNQQSLDSNYQYILICFAISILVGVIGVTFMVYSSNGRAKVNSTTYLDKSSVNMNDSYEKYIRTSVVTRHIPRNDNNNIGGSTGGGSSTHTSSGGYTHGGGGGSF